MSLLLILTGIEPIKLLKYEMKIHVQTSTRKHWNWDLNRSLYTRVLNSGVHNSQKKIEATDKHDG